MEKVYLGEHGGYHYYMADKVYSHLDWWEATALAEQLGGELPTLHKVSKFKDEIESTLGEKVLERHKVWHGKTYFGNLAYVIPLERLLEDVLGVSIASKSDKADTLIFFKEVKKVGEPIEVVQSLTKSKDFLKKALEVQDSRASEYDTDGKEERNMGKIVSAFNAITGHALTEAEGYLFMETLKNVRLFGAPSFHEDSAVDCISYASLKAEAKAKEV